MLVLVIDVGVDVVALLDLAEDSAWYSVDM